MSPDRHGSGATRIEADLSINRGEKTDAQSIHLSCRARLPCRPWRCRPSASAAPTVTFKAKAVPIPPGFPHTGNILGAGAAVEAEFTITGTEYGGRVPAAADRRQLVPAGGREDCTPQGFPTCTERDARKQPARQAARRSRSAGPTGTALGDRRRSAQNASLRKRELQSFYAPGGGLEFFTRRPRPVSLEIRLEGPLRQLRRGGFGPELEVDGAARRNGAGRAVASVKSIKVKVGSAIKKGKKLIYYGTRADEVPEGRLPGEGRTDVRRPTAANAKPVP